MTFGELAEKFMTDAGRSETTCTLYRDVLTRDAFPLFGDKPAAAVNVDDIFAMCRQIKARPNKPTSVAQLTKSAVGGVYKFGINNGYVKTSPTRGVPNQQEGKSVRKRVPKDEEIAALWKVTGQKDRTSQAIKIIVRLAILTGQRRTEVAGAMVSEVKGGVWTIPAVSKKSVPGRRMKIAGEQRVYLSTQAAELFAEALRECSDGTYFFQSQGVRGKPLQKTRQPHIAGDSVKQAMRALREKAGVEDVGIHDMRRAIATYIGDNDVPEIVIKMILHHARDDVTGVHYDKAKREKQLRDAWRMWSDHVDAIVASPATVSGEPVPEAVA